MKRCGQNFLKRCRACTRVWPEIFPELPVPFSYHFIGSRSRAVKNKDLVLLQMWSVSWPFTLRHVWGKVVSKSPLPLHPWVGVDEANGTPVSSPRFWCRGVTALYSSALVGFLPILLHIVATSTYCSHCITFRKAQLCNVCQNHRHLLLMAFSNEGNICFIKFCYSYYLCSSFFLNFRRACLSFESNINRDYA